MVAIADKFGKSSISTDYAIATTVKTARLSGVTVLEAIDLSKFAPDTPVFFITYKKTTDPVTGIVSVTNQVSWKAIVNTGANTLTNLVVAPGYTDSGNAIGDFIECIPTSMWENSLIDGIFVGHNPDGSFKTSAVNTALQAILDGGLNATLANQLSYANLLINGACMVAQRYVTPNISTTYQYGKVDRFAAKATGTAVSAGTITQLTSSLLAATKGYDLQIAGLTVTGTGIAYLRYRVEAKDAMAFVNAIASFSCRVYHNVGSSVNYTIFINKANAADNFSATTAVANSGAISVPTATATLIKFENINAGSLGDVSNGLEIEIQIACGAVTTKNFNFAEFMFNKGATAGTFSQKSFHSEMAACLRYYNVVRNPAQAYSSFASAFVGNPFSFQVALPVVMRTLPTLVWSVLVLRFGGADFSVTAASAVDMTSQGVSCLATPTGAPGNGNVGAVVTNGGTFYLDAEL